MEPGLQVGVSRPAGVLRVACGGTQVVRLWSRRGAEARVCPRCSRSQRGPRRVGRVRRQARFPGGRCAAGEAAVSSRQGRCRRRRILRAAGRRRVQCRSGSGRSRAALVKVAAKVVVRSGWTWRSRLLGRFHRGAGAGAERERGGCCRIRRGRRKGKIESQRRRR